MIISHSKKFIFIACRKTASMSFHKLLEKYCCSEDLIIYNSDIIPYNYHSSILTIKNELTDEQFNDYFKFAFVRNPFDYLVSCYHYLIAMDNSLFRFWKSNYRKKPFLYSTLYLYRYFKNRIKSKKLIFKKFVIQYIKKKYRNNYDLVTIGGKNVMDIVFKYENLDESLELLFSFLNIKSVELPKEHTQFRDKKIHYSKYYDKELISIVKNYFKKELEMFVYKFNIE